MKILLACAVLIAASLAEPPVNRYLPPQGLPRNSPAQVYGAPGFGGQKQTGALFRQPSSIYGAPSKSRLDSQYLPPSNQYGLPRSSHENQTPNNQYLPPTSQYQTPTNKYLPPTNQRQSLTKTYLPPTIQYQPPSNKYLPPTNERQSPTNKYLQPSSQYETPSNQYGLPTQVQTFGQSTITSQYNAPSQEYGTPEFDRAGNDYNEQSRQYLPPGGGYDDGSNGEPANYNFEYMVKDAYSGNDFGHRESRQGDRAEGLYYVLLPDGRKQIVEYEADQEGYKPRISYEDTGARSGYGASRQSDYENQHPSGPY